MEKFYKFGKIMAFLVMLGGIAISIVLAVNFFTTAAAYSSSSYYYNVASGTKASLIWYGIGSLLIGTVFSVGNYVLWNILIEMYANSCAMKNKICGNMPQANPMYTQAPQQFAQPVQPIQQQSAIWYCPNCGSFNKTVLSGRDFNIKEIHVIENN